MAYNDISGFPIIRPSMQFDPRDMSQKAAFWRSHDKIMDRFHAWTAIQAGPNPLTQIEFRKLQQRHPDKYTHLPWIPPQVGK